MASTSGAIRAGRAFVELFTDTKQLEKGLKGTQVKLRRFAAATQQLGRQLMSAAAIGAAPIAMATRTFAGFEDQMAVVRAVTQATEGDFKKLTEQAKELGRTTSFTAKQVAEGMTSLGRAGFKSGEIESSIGAVLNLSRATGTELGPAADIAAQAIRAFGLDASDTTRVADVLVATANNSAQVLDDLGESFAYVAPIAAESGESIESTAKMLGVLANMGIKGSMAGTTLRQAMLQIADPKIQAQLRSMGVTAEFVAGNMGEVMTQIGSAMAAMPRDQRLALAKDLFGQRAVTGALKLTGGPDQMRAVSDAIDNAGGAAAKTAATMDATLGGAFRRLMSAVEGVQIAIGETLSASIEGYSIQITEAATRMTGWIKENQGIVKGALALVVALGSAGAAIYALSLAMKAGSVISGTYLLALSNPITALVVAFGLLAAAGVAYNQWVSTAANSTELLIQRQEKLAESTQNTVERLKELAGQETLTDTERQETIALITLLEAKYGSLGVVIDETTGKIQNMAEVQERANTAMEAGAKAELQAELAKLEKEYTIIASRLEHANKQAARYDGKLGEIAARNTKAIADELAQNRKRQQELRGRLAPEKVAEAAAPAPADLTPRDPMSVMARYLRLGADAGGTFLDGLKSKLEVNQDLLDNLARVRIAGIDDDLERDLATIRQRYQEMRRAARADGKETGLLDTAEAEEITQARAKDAEKRAEKAMELAKSEAAIQAENERLLIETTFQGPERDRELLDLERRLALAEAKEAGIDPDLIREQFSLREALLDQQLDAGRSGTTASGTFSAAAAMAMGRGTGRDPALQKLDKQIELLQQLGAAVERGVLVLD